MQLQFFLPELILHKYSVEGYVCVCALVCVLWKFEWLVLFVLMMSILAPRFRAGQSNTHETIFLVMQVTIPMA